MTGIYKITSPNKRIYIGQSINLEKRFTTYRRMDCKGQKRLYQSFLKYGVDKHLFEVLLECSESELNNLERYYQEIYSCIGSGGLNCKISKDDQNPYRHSEETKKKIGLSHKGRKYANRKYVMTDEHKNKIGLGNKGRKRPDVAIRFAEINKIKIGEKNNFFGKTHSEETKRIISSKIKGKYDGCLSVRAIVYFDIAGMIFVSQNEIRKLINCRSGQVEISINRRGLEHRFIKCEL